jgi:hypothetical protein
MGKKKYTKRLPNKEIRDDQWLELAVDLPIGAYVCLAAPYAHGSGGATV